MKRLSLTNTAFEGNNNVYLLDGGSQLTLVDTGDHTEETLKQLRERLASYDITVPEIDRIVLTHWHHDHSGLAHEIQRASGCTVHCHEADAPLVRGDRGAWESLWATMNARFSDWQIPRPEQETLEELLYTPDRYEHTVEVTPFTDGDSFSIKGQELQAIHLSGHAAGLCMFEFDGDRGPEILSGDALLPRYTPNVGGADVRVNHPLRKYLKALELIRDRGYRKAWPGHRTPIDDPPARAEEIFEHHEERAWRVLDVLDRRGPSTPWSVSAELFGTLESIHILHGPGEAFAHLNHLEDDGAVVRGGATYRIADSAKARLRSLSNERWPLTP